MAVAVGVLWVLLLLVHTCSLDAGQPSECYQPRGSRSAAAAVDPACQWLTGM